jgi:hypothetical protein
MKESSMSDARIPPSNGDLKPVSLGDLVRLAEETNKFVEHTNERLGPDCPVHFSLMPIPRPNAKPSSDKAAKPPRRQRPKADPDTYTPIEHTLYSLQAFGFTHPSDGRYLMAPKEFRAILALETKAVAAVVWEIMQQTIGWEGDGPGCRREWVHLTVRHFERTNILSRAQAERGIKRALAMGYITRRQVGDRCFEYAIRWKGTN